MRGTTIFFIFFYKGFEQNSQKDDAAEVWEFYNRSNRDFLIKIGID